MSGPTNEENPYEASADASSSAPQKPVGDGPITGMVVFRSIMAFLAPWIVMFVLALAYQVPLLYFSDPDNFMKTIELMQDPDAFTEAVESGEVPVAGTGVLAGSVVGDFLICTVGGFLCCWIAARAKWKHGVVYAVLLTLFSCFYAATSEMEAVLPAWVPWSRALLATPGGILLGAWLRTGCCKK